MSDPPKKRKKRNVSALLLVPFYLNGQALLFECVELQATPSVLLNNNRVYGCSRGHSAVDMTIEFGQGGGIDFWVGGQLHEAVLCGVDIMIGDVKTKEAAAGKILGGGWGSGVGG